METTQDNPLAQGIKVIGVGKHGSKPLSDTQLRDISAYLQHAQPDPIQLGAFYGALLAKGPTPAEQILLRTPNGQPLANPEALYDWLCPDAPPELRPIGVALLRKETLPAAEARQLGDFLFSDAPGEALRGMAASMMRIRYETDDEYQGLLAAVEASFAPGFRQPFSAGKPLLQLAEPFDGVEHSFLITPLLAQAFQRQGYTVITTLGRSSGPKLTLNALDLYAALDSPLLRHAAQLTEPAPAYGWALPQHLLSPFLDAWVERRRRLVKRPFLATLEKILNPCGARLLVTSVFHLTYLEKMLTLARMAGFAGALVLKRGLEGTLAPSIARASGLICGVWDEDGPIKTQAFEATQEEFAGFRAESDAVVADVSAEENARLIQLFSTHGTTGNPDFDLRVHLALNLYQRGLAWLEEHLPKAYNA